ncbi:DUF7522 family protein [Salarchaeum japonicum]|uniref:DUF7522 family protein n=1 Tax=Salarchaeum japonicum TaxID=555573 RepID=UPI003C7635EB
MPEQPANELVEFLREQAGDYLRAAIHYTEHDHDVLYIRDDVAGDYTDAELATFVDHYRTKSREQQPDRPFDLGHDHCTISVYDEAILFHFTLTTTVGTIITLAPEAGRDIVQFITHCLEQLHHNSPQSIGPVPTWLQN